MPVFALDENITFPYPELAEPDGLLAIGGDLSVDRLLLAYTNGIFPWYNPEDEILWWAPKRRFIIRPENIHVSHSMRKYFRKHDIFLDINRDFADTVHRCRMKRENTKDGTWISDDIEKAYLDLYNEGFCLSVEAWVDGELAGGLYGVIIGKCFFGESMFSEKENGSKLALIMLAKMLEEEHFYMIDCQLHTDHLESMGGEYIGWTEYKGMLEAGIEYEYE
ncbi:MAG: leucyl/phenylalanyl-tRNA--protein transferase [Lachnospiraceae bacterium]|nr:leucyl/phenylalanyl-tRNA--protein transferase [Lachnospiraceae bacterium]